MPQPNLINVPMAIYSAAIRFKMPFQSVETLLPDAVQFLTIVSAEFARTDDVTGQHDVLFGGFNRHVK